MFRNLRYYPCPQVTILLGCLLTLVLPGSIPTAVAQLTPTCLRTDPGDVIVPQLYFPDYGVVWQVDHATQRTCVLFSTPAEYSYMSSIARLSATEFVVAVVNMHAVIKLSLATHDWSVYLTDSHLVQPMGLTVGPSGDTFVVGWGGQQVCRIDPVTRALSIVAYLDEPNEDYNNVACDAAGALYVTRPPDAVVRIDPASGAKTVLSSSELLTNPWGIVAHPDGNIYVTASEQIVRVDPTGNATVVSKPGVGPLFGMSVATNGDLIVCAPGNVGKIIRVELSSGRYAVVGTFFGNAFSLYAIPGDQVVAVRAAEHQLGFDLKPNPSREVVTLRFELRRPADVELAIYDVQGRRVRKLLDGRAPAGPNVVAWDGRNDTGKSVSPGAYFARLGSSEARSVKKLIRIR